MLMLCRTACAVKASRLDELQTALLIIPARRFVASGASSVFAGTCVLRLTMRVVIR